ncbi:MAG: cation transporter, partial [Hyphomicrobiaceae bacterium]
LGWSEADAIASILIGLILGGVAAFMSIETKALLIGEAASPAVVGKIRRFIEAEMGSGPVVAINELRTMHLGPEDVLVAASLDFRDGETAKGVEAAVGRIDAAIKKRFPEVRYLFLDVQSGARAAPATLLGSTEPVASRPVEEATQARPLASLAQLAKGAPDVPRKTYPPSKRAKSKKRR